MRLYYGYGKGGGAAGGGGREEEEEKEEKEEEVAENKQNLTQGVRKINILIRSPGELPCFF